MYPITSSRSPNRKIWRLVSASKLSITVAEAPSGISLSNSKKRAEFSLRAAVSITVTAICSRRARLAARTCIPVNTSAPINVTVETRLSVLAKSKCTSVQELDRINRIQGSEFSVLLFGSRQNRANPVDLFLFRSAWGWRNCRHRWQIGTKHVGGDFPFAVRLFFPNLAVLARILGAVFHRHLVGADQTAHLTGLRHFHASGFPTDL